MIGTVLKDEKKKMFVPKAVSAWQPPKDVADLTNRISQDFTIGYDLHNRPFEEFNDQSLIGRVDIDQKRWNAYRAPQSQDIDEAWRWDGIRPITRNKIIGIVAQMTANIAIPAPFAQNDKDEIDRLAAQVMRDLMEFNIRNSNYVDAYIMYLIDALVNPVAYLGIDFVEAMQTIRENVDGKISKKEVIDTVMSGFQVNNIPIDEVLISNFYLKSKNGSIDNQRFLIRRRTVDYDTAKSLHGDSENFEFVQVGVRTIFNAEDSLFYDANDKNLQTLAEEATYYNRLEDMEVTYVNGIYVGSKDVESNPIKHRDNEERPKYNITALGYEHISSRFFFYKSAAWKLGDDDELVIRTEQLLADATFLETMPPTITSGIGQMSEAIMIPGKNTAFENPDVRVSGINVGRSLSGAFNLLLKKERDVSESTQDPLLSGIQSGPQKTKGEVDVLQQNARIALGLFGNMLASSLRGIGGLMIDVIIQHQTVMDIEQVSENEVVEKWKTFILQDVEEEGQKLNKKIIFNPDLLGEEGLSEEESMQRSQDILKKEGGIKSNTRIFEVNPDKWRRLKFQMIVDVDELLPLFMKERIREAEQQLKEQQIKPTETRKVASV